MARSLVLLLSVTACAHGGLGPSGHGDALPVKKVVLYQNGVGYFERAGLLHGDTLRLQVRPEQINDLLTSLTVIDRLGGRSQSISLPIEKSAAQRLDELPEQVRREGGIYSLLSAFRGARISLSLRDGGDRVQGRVIGVEPIGGEPHVALARGDEISNVPVSAIERLKLHDRPLQVGLNKVLDHSLKEGQWKPVELTVRLNKKGKHDLLVSYIAGMPTWKPAYRLVMGKADEKALLQGWAVIDNTSGEDWTNVRLSLSSGAPISFIYDLHKPHFVNRRRMGMVHSGANAPVARAGVAAPPAVQSAFGRGGIGSLGAGVGGGGRGYKVKARRKVGKSAEKKYKKSGRLDFESLEEEMEPEYSLSLSQLASAQAGGARGSAVGGLFRYDVDGPVTVPDRSSTLVSLVNRRIEGEDLLLYRPDAGGAAVKHPYRAVRFKNDTGYMLQGGPVSVLARGTFVGSGIFNRIEDGAETFLPFSLEQGVSISRRSKHKEKPVKLLSIVNGRISCQLQSRKTHIYEILSRTKDAPSRIYLRMTKRPGWKLDKKPEGTKELDGVWYIPATVGLGKSEFSITEFRDHPQTVIWDSAIGQQVLKLYLENPDANPSLAKALDALKGKRSELNELRAKSGKLRVRKNELSREQDRIRRNIKTLGEAKVNQRLARDFSKRLGANEKAIAEINGEIVKLDESIYALTQQLKVMVENLRLK